MAKIMITFEDKPDGQVNVVVDFDPPMKKDEDATPAQYAGAAALQAAMRTAKQYSEDDLDDEED